MDSLGASLPVWSKLHPVAVLKDGGSFRAVCYQKRPHVDNRRDATQRILVSIQVKQKVRWWITFMESKERNTEKEEGTN